MALTILVSAARIGAQSAPSAFPDWMSDLLPKTAEEKARAAAFDAYGQDIVKLGTSSILFKCGAMFQSAEDTRPAYYEFLTAKVCEHDAVAFGTPTPVAVRLNNRGTYLFTEHSFRVQRWVHPAAETRLDIEVLTPGGVLSIGAQTASHVQSGHEIESGKEYLLFLKRVPGSAAFTIVGSPISPTATWERALQSPLLPYELEGGEIPFDRFIDDLAIAAGNCRKKR